MKIKMAGIDHSKASLGERELFTFTKTGAVEAMHGLKSGFNLEGCLLISTCNRTELWLSGEDLPSPAKLLCLLKGLAYQDHLNFFIERSDEEAAGHLGQVVCGFDSKVFGEDQIISQVREALELARDSGTADGTLEKLFQSALAAGKKVKARIQVSRVRSSAAGEMVKILLEKMGSLKDVPCLVIGNGQMGKLAAMTLLEQGGRVSMTLRRGIHGREPQESMVIPGCRMISYDERFSELAIHSVIVSATLSPHFTLLKSEVEGRLTGEQYFLFDLAVPRDLDPSIGDLENVWLYDIDDLGLEESEAETLAIRGQAEEILNQYLEETREWFMFREHVPTIEEIVKLVSEDTLFRLGEAGIKRDEIENGTIEEASLKGKKSGNGNDVVIAVEKAVSKLMFGLKRTLPPELWEESFRALHLSASRDTAKH